MGVGAHAKRLLDGWRGSRFQGPGSRGRDLFPGPWPLAPGTFFNRHHLRPRALAVADRLAQEHQRAPLLPRSPAPFLFQHNSPLHEFQVDRSHLQATAGRFRQVGEVGRGVGREVGRPLLQVVGDDAQPGGDAAEGVEAAHLRLAEVAAEHLVEGGDERRAAGADDGVDLVRPQARLAHRLLQVALDGPRLAADEALELGAGDELAHAEAGAIEVDLRAALLGERPLGSLDHVEHLQPVVAAHQGQQRLDLVLALGGLGDLAQDLPVLGRVELQQRLPVVERVVDPLRRGQRLVARAIEAALAEVARQLGADELLVEHVPGHGDAARRQHARPPLAQAHDGDVERAAAEVEDERVLRARQAQGIAVGGGHRLVLQVDRFVAGAEGGVEQARLGQAVGVRVGGEMDGAAEHHLPRLLPQQLLRPRLGDGQVEGDERLQRVVELADDRAGVVLVAQAGLDGQEEAAGREGVGPGVDVGDVVDPVGDDLQLADPDLLHLDRPVEVVGEVEVDGGAADGDRLLVGDVERRPGDARVGGRRVERQHRHRPPVVDGHAAVGRAEVHAEDHGPIIASAAAGATHFLKCVAPSSRGSGGAGEQAGGGAGRRSLALWERGRERVFIPWPLGRGPSSVVLRRTCNAPQKVRRTESLRAAGNRAIRENRATIRP